MKMNKLLGIAMAAAVSAGGLRITSAGATDTSERPARARILERVKEKLDLTDDQVAQIKAELGQEKETIKNLILKMHEARAGVREAIRASNATEASVRAAAAKIGAVQADLAVERFKLYGRINPILTDEQRQKVKEMESRIDEWVESAVNRIGERKEAE
jgi:Spy/CpxP family protein refolding chaperone